MATVNTVKSCCGGSTTLVTSAKPVLMNHIPLFKNNGFFVNDKYATSGLFYARKDGMIATATFGTCKFNVRCSGSGCDLLIAQFTNILGVVETQ